MYYRGKMFGFVHLYNGQEAVSSGVIRGCLRKDDYVCSTYRDHVHSISKARYKLCACFQIGTSPLGNQRPAPPRKLSPQP